ncbi:MAG: hypothetical protein ACE5J7_00125 [Candidatus Aenigmatarchaeota archaeon]
MVAPVFNIEYMIFEQILKISSTTLARYPELTDKLLYLILIPHVVLLLFLWSFGIWAARGHRGFQMLISIAGYLFFILSGIYGSFLAPIISGFFILWLGIAFLTFIVVRIIPPIYGPGVRGFGKAVAQKAAEKTVAKTAKKKALKKQLELVNKRIKETQRKWPTTEEARRARELKLQELRDLRVQIEHELEEL